MGRIRKGSKQLVANVDPSVIADVDELARRSGNISRSEYLRRLVEHAKKRNIHWTAPAVQEGKADYGAPPVLHEIKPSPGDAPAESRSRQRQVRK